MKVNSVLVTPPLSEVEVVDHCIKEKSSWTSIDVKWRREPPNSCVVPG